MHDRLDLGVQSTPMLMSARTHRKFLTQKHRKERSRLQTRRHPLTPVLDLEWNYGCSIAPFWPLVGPPRSGAASQH
jgi:hypothetical protein